MNIDVTIGNDVTRRGEKSSSLGRIDQYELVRELGGGGFGCVFLAKDTVAGIEVAVKGLPPEVRHNKEELENIRENFALVSRLHHPNIAAALVLHPAKEVSYATRDVRERLRVSEGDTLLVMEYAPGSTLSSWRKQIPGRLVPFATAVDIVRQVAAALDYAHVRKIVHRDIKPANVMIGQTDAGGYDVRVLDFGLAAEIRSSMGRVSREIRDMSGTRPYMSPEQWGGEKQGPATDQYALAVMFCELIAGEVPYQSVFDTGDTLAMMTNVIHRPARIPDAVPDRARRALERALAKKPEDRFVSCGAFVEALGGHPFPWQALVIGVLLAALGAVVWWKFASGGRAGVGPTEEPSPGKALAPATNAVDSTPRNPLGPKPPSSPEQTPKSVVSSSNEVAVKPSPRTRPLEPIPEERFPLSRRFAGEKMPHDTDYAREFQRQVRKAASGDADAQYCVGWMYKRGLGVAANPALARRYVEKAAKNGNTYAQRALEEEDE